MKIKIPKGWKRLQPRTEVRPGDREWLYPTICEECGTKKRGKWQTIEEGMDLAPVGEYSNWNGSDEPDFVIRKVKP